MKIKQIELLSNDLLNTERFYHEILGLYIRDKNTSRRAFNVGESVLQFSQTYIQHPVYHFAFNIPNNKIKEAEQSIFSKIPLLEYQDQNIINFKAWNAMSMYFHDNNGNGAEFIAPCDLDNKTDNPFDGSGILSISEMTL